MVWQTFSRSSTVSLSPPCLGWDSCGPEVFFRNARFALRRPGRLCGYGTPAGRPCSHRTRCRLSVWRAGWLLELSRLKSTTFCTDLTCFNLFVLRPGPWRGGRLSAALADQATTALRASGCHARLFPQLFTFSGGGRPFGSRLAPCTCRPFRYAPIGGAVIRQGHGPAQSCGFVIRLSIMLRSISMTR